MYKDIIQVKETLFNLKKLGHLKNFEYELITDYIECLNNSVDNVIKENFTLKEEKERLNAQLEVYKNILDKYIGSKLFEEGEE